MAPSASRSPDYGSELPPLASLPDPPTVRSFGISDPGQVRTNNEDRFLVAELARTLWVNQTNVPQSQTQHGRHRAHVLLVADGMGGHQAGEVASSLTVASIEEYVLHLLQRFSNLQGNDEAMVLRDFQEAVRRTDAQIAADAAQHPDHHGMGTTLTLALSSGWLLFVVHAGDSRCYLFRGGELCQVTRDHTWVGEMARHGLIKPENMKSHQFRHVITNYLGGKEEVWADIHKVVLQPGDVILLCSDGLTDMLEDSDLTAILTADAEPEAACTRLVQRANERGGKDNVTAVVASFHAAQ